MLAAFLLAALVAAPLATLALFAAGGGRRRSRGALAVTRRLLVALVATVVLAIIAGAVLHALGATRANTVAGAAGLIVVSLLWLPATRRWNGWAHLAWASTFYLFAAYLVYMLWWTYVSHLGVIGTIGALILWAMEAGAAFLGVAYLWELCDALGREDWRRRVANGVEGTVPDSELPFVSLQVPAYNEPPEMVIETLSSLLALDYPAYQVIVIDDNTDDEQLWRPVEAWCQEHGVAFAHLADWPGYKSGALNYALREMIDPRTELIGVIDADYQLEPGFLRACAPLFADDSIGFIQAPQDYRDWEQAPFYRRLYYSYKYFFAVSQPSRNERDGAIFAGTMGLIRRQALEGAGGWDEWCITEDAELSLRLLRDGWSGLHVDRSFGHGVMPLTFEALKGQRFRWCFGGIQILRRHWRLMLPGGGRDNRMSLGQRWAYLSGGVQWYGDLLAVMFYLFLLLGAANVALGAGLMFRKLSGFLLAAIPLLALLGLVRAVALLRRGTGASWRDALGAFMIWQSTSVVVARASVQGLFAKEAEFLRTPKTAEDARWWDAVRGNLPESLLALLGLAGIVGSAAAAGTAGLVTAALLVWPTTAFLSAPLNSLAAQRATLPGELASRRSTEYRRFGARPATITLAGLLAVVGTVAVAAILLAPAGQQAVSPNPITPARGHHPSPAVHSSSTTSPSAPTSSATTTTPTTSAPATPTTSAPTSAPTTVPTTAPTTAPTTTTTSTTASP